MSSKTKIVVFKMRELIYTGIFVALGILLIILCIWMFTKKEGSENSSGNKNTGQSSQTEEAADALSDSGTTNTAVSTDTVLTPGCYTSTILLGTQTLEVWICVDSDHINSVGFTSLDETVTTMYPLMETTMESIRTQIQDSQSFDITYSDDTRYTSQTIVNALAAAYQLAVVEDEES